jgi:hypothetical protein
MVFNLTHSQIILRYKENGGRIEPYTIVNHGAGHIRPHKSEGPDWVTSGTLPQKVCYFRFWFFSENLEKVINYWLRASKVKLVCYFRCWIVSENLEKRFSFLKDKTLCVLRCYVTLLYPHLIICVIVVRQEKWVFTSTTKSLLKTKPLLMSHCGLLIENSMIILLIFSLFLRQQLLQGAICSSSWLWFYRCPKTNIYSSQKQSE